MVDRSRSRSIAQGVKDRTGPDFRTLLETVGNNRGNGSSSDEDRSSDFHLDHDEDLCKCVLLSVEEGGVSDQRLKNWLG